MTKITVVLTAGLMMLLLSAGGSSANSNSQKVVLKQVFFSVSSGPTSVVRRGQRFSYQIDLLNGRNAALKNVQMDVFLLKQTIVAKSLKLEMSPGTKTMSKMLVGHHVRWLVSQVPGRAGEQILLNAQVSKTATGSLCNKLTVRFGGKSYDYSPPCVTIAGGGL